MQADSLPAEPQGKPKNTGVGSLSLLQWIFPTQESNWGLLHCRQILHQLSYPESQEELKSLLIKVKDDSEKADLKLNIQKTKIMASGLITSWQINGETVADFILGGSKITADGDCSHEIKKCLLLGRKAMTNLDSLLKAERSLC